MPFTEEDLTPIVPKGQEESLEDLSYFDLVRLAQDKKIPSYANMTKQELIIALGAAPKGAAVHDRTVGMSEAQMMDLQRRELPIPGKTIYDPKYEDQLQKIWAVYPLAFNNVDMTDKKARVQFHFEREVECACGENFKIARIYEAKLDGEKVIREQTKDIYQRFCPKCGRNHIFLDPDREIPVDPAIARKAGLIK